MVVTTTKSICSVSQTRTVVAINIAHYFPGADYNNVRVKDFVAARFVDKCMVDTRKVPRMPWRDIQVRLEGEVVKDMGRNFIQYWSFIKNDFAQQKESRKLGVSAAKESNKKMIKNDSLEDLKYKKYVPKSSLVPASRQNNNIFDFSLEEDDSTLTKHEKNVDRIPEVEEAIESKRQTKRFYQSVDNNTKVELEGLIHLIKEGKEIDPEDEFLEK